MFCNYMYGVLSLRIQYTKHRSCDIQVLFFIKHTRTRMYIAQATNMVNVGRFFRKTKTHTVWCVWLVVPKILLHFPRPIPRFSTLHASRFTLRTLKNWELGWSTTYYRASTICKIQVYTTLTLLQAFNIITCTILTIVRSTTTQHVQLQL